MKNVMMNIIIIQNKFYYLSQYFFFLFFYNYNLLNLNSKHEDIGEVYTRSLLIFKILNIKYKK
jgi:hypothetical protein